jgi:hypothetical protein
MASAPKEQECKTQQLPGRQVIQTIKLTRWSLFLYPLAPSRFSSRSPLFQTLGQALQATCFVKPGDSSDLNSTLKMTIQKLMERNVFLNVVPTTFTF